MIRPLHRLSVSEVILIAAVFWVAVIGISFAVNMRNIRKSVYELAFTSTRIVGQREILYIQWFACRGPVYASAEKLKEGVRLSPDSDGVSTAGNRMVRVNPAEISRQINSNEDSRYDIVTRIVGFESSSDSEPSDDWERSSLPILSPEESERSIVDLSGDQGRFRYMKALFADESCMACHQDSEFASGDIVGGMSVSFSMEPFIQGIENQQLKSGLNHFGFLAGGLVIIMLTGYFLRKGNLEKVSILNKLVNANQRHRMIFESSQEGLWEWDMADNTIYLSARWKEILGYRDSEVRALPGDMAKLFEPVQYEKLKSGIRQYLQCGDGQFSTELEMNHKNGSGLSVLIRAQLLKDDNGKPEKLIGTMTDMTAVRNSEYKVIESERKFRSLFENMLSGFVLFQSFNPLDKTAADDYRVTEYNSAFMEISGLSRDRLYNRRLREIFPSITDDLQRDCIEIAVSS